MKNHISEGNFSLFHKESGKHFAQAYLEPSALLVRGESSGMFDMENGYYVEVSSLPQENGDDNRFIAEVYAKTKGEILATVAPAEILPSDRIDSFWLKGVGVRDMIGFLNAIARKPALPDAQAGFIDSALRYSDLPFGARPVRKLEDASGLTMSHRTGGRAKVLVL